ncbi:MAG TPA: class I SAM-dependent methyltransferase [Allosphingosinicella sp.]|nr:class I SAM-dependent methyltransferase [Allosphingosinicella sp.]
MSRGAGSAQSFALNRASWDERVAVHVASRFYDVDAFRAGKDMLGPIESAEIGSVDGLRVAHLQCHFGLDSLSLARRGARVTGLDFSAKAVAAARQLADETGIDAAFVEGNVYDAPALLGAGCWDLVFTTWGTVTWLPNIAGWAEVVAALLVSGGRLYFLDSHPVALALGQTEAGAPLGPTFDYFHGAAPLEFDEGGSYADPAAELEHSRTHEWIHPLGSTISALLAAGLRLTALREHDAVAWQLYPSMRQEEDGLWRLPPDHPRLPVAVTIEAVKP